MNKVTKPYLRILGDVHGKLSDYLHAIKGSKYSLCVGDVGFSYSYLTRLLDAECGKMIGGNHDNYNKKSCENCVGENCKICEGRGHVYYDQSKHFLGDFGTWDVPNFGPIFYVRGAWSIDKEYRTIGCSWWPDEELNVFQMQKALAKYTEVKPDFMVTHTAPQCIVPSIPFKKIFGETIHHPRTEQLLEAMWEVHQPKIWVFGHWHKDWFSSIGHPKTGIKTLFICLDELHYIDFQENFQISNVFEPIIHT